MKRYSEKCWMDFAAAMPVETKEQFEARVDSFLWNSVPEDGELWTAASLKDKVLGSEEAGEKGIDWSLVGTLKPFYGNTLVFPLKQTDIAYVEKIQKRLYEKCGHMFAEPLVPDTFHMTLHDLENGPDQEALSGIMGRTGFAALSMLEQLKRMDLPSVQMESACIFNMASTSVVLGLKPANEESCRSLMLLYELFQAIKPLNYKLTPHITLAYYKPGIYSSDELEALREVIEEGNHQEKLRVTFDVKDLVYQVFYSMNHYVTMELETNTNDHE